MSKSVLIFIFLILFGCSDKKDEPEKQIVDVPVFSQYSNLSLAPQPIVDASKAVVRVAEHGTGFFISKDGILATNNHVLGVGECIRSGCYVKIDFDFQTEHGYESTSSYFAEPLLIDITLDFAIYQIKQIDADGVVGDKLETPNYLSFTEESSSSLDGKEIFIVGHPNANLKKWFTAKVFKNIGSWFFIDKMTLGGNSGSPVLNDKGQIVGILHRGSEDVSRNGMKGYSICSAANELVKTLGKSSDFSSETLKNNEKITVLSDMQKDSISKSTALSNKTKMLYARFSKYKDDSNVEQHIVKAFAELCDQIIEMPFAELDSPDTASEYLYSCFSVTDWLNCSLPDQGKDYQTCPSEDKDAWVARMDKLSEKAIEVNEDKPFAYTVFGRANFETTQEDFWKTANSTLNEFLGKYDYALDFGIAYYKALTANSSNDLTYHDTDLVQYLLNFEQVDNYRFYITDIAQGIILLYETKSITESQTVSSFNRIFADPDLTLKEKLQVEMLLYKRNLLKN